MTNLPKPAFEENMVWVQCESPSCLKWRLVTQVDSGGRRLDTEQAWFCSRNPDPAYSSCTVAQEPSPTVSQLNKHGLTFVYSLLPVRSLVLAKTMTWPRWPAILSPDPDTGMYVVLDSIGNVDSYHVEFLGRPRSRNWVMAGRVESYQPATVKELRAVKGYARKSYALAVQEATEFTNMSCEERLHFCHFQPNDILSKVQDLMGDSLLTPCESGGSSSQRRHSKEERPESCLDGDALIIEGFNFESAACREGLRRSGSKPRPSNI